jgi:hypothetical protein
MPTSHRFTGVLAVLHTTTADGRRLDDPAPELTRPLPLPLVRPGEPGIGRIERVWRDGDLIRYSGQLDDAHPDAAEIRSEITAGRLVGMLDADSAEPEYRQPSSDMMQEAERPPDADPDVLLVFHGWRVRAATLMPSEGRVWPEVSLTLE